ncbi:MAG TPA: hypothetical protein VFN97_14365 [Actinospica sp.]|nr:hypothetical protein [Actinospica sp.]
MTERDDERAPQRDEQDRRPRLNLTMSQVAASALAACCASVVASYLGVAGTVIGAAVGSVVATTGAAIWGHLFHRGGEKIKQTLLVNGELVEVERDEVPAVPAGRFYGANGGGESAPTANPWTPKDPTAETRLIAPEEPAPRAKRFLKYGKPIGIAAAVVAVFSVSIVVGMFAGAPVRDAGASTTPSTTTMTTVTETTHGTVGDSSSTSSGPSASRGSGAEPSSSASSSSSASTTPSASSSASPGASAATSSAAGATGTAQAQGATSTGSP